MVKIPERSELDHLGPLESPGPTGKNWTKGYWRTKKVAQLINLSHIITVIVHVMRQCIPRGLYFFPGYVSFQNKRICTTSGIPAYYL